MENKKAIDEVSHTSSGCPSADGSLLIQTISRSQEITTKSKKKLLEKKNRQGKEALSNKRRSADKQE